MDVRQSQADNQTQADRIEQLSFLYGSDRGAARSYSTHSVEEA